MLGGDRVHLQQATASDAAVVIQVGRDLYLSDANLSELWVPREAKPGECPFPGLDAFGPGQSQWFFGRAELTGELLGRLDDALERHHCGGPVLVVGPSGAGKSSLLGAGLMPAIAQGRLPAAGSDRWPRIVLTPGSDPLGTLRAALRACEEARGEPPGDRGPVVLVVDQLEELFTLCGDDRTRAAYLEEIARLATADGNGRPAAVVALGLRADFYPQATGYEVLREAMAARQLVLGAMSPDDLRKAITLPARAAGLHLDDGLTERLLRDLGVDEASGYEPGRLPLLAHALRATWRGRDGDRLTIAAYAASGGIGGAITKTAEDVYSELDEAGQRAARGVFLSLVRVGEAATGTDGEGTADTRRRVSAPDLYAAADDESAARAVVAAFTRARLLTAGQQTVQITHEALLTHWQRLRGWIGDDRAGNLLRQRVEADAAAWQAESRDRSLLYGGTRLATALAWAGERKRGAPDGQAGTRELGRVARDFLDESRRRRRRGALWRTGIAAVVTALLIGLAGAVGYGIRENAASAAQAAIAAQQSRITRSETLTFASANALAQGDPGSAMELAVQAERVEPSSQEAVSALLSTQADPFAGRIAKAGGGGGVGDVAWNQDGSLLATADLKGYVRLWNPVSRSAAGQIGPLPGGAAGGIAFSPNQPLLAVAVTGGVQLWDITHPAHPVPLRPLTWGGDAAGSAVAFSKDGTRLAAATNFSDDSIFVWDVASGSLTSSFHPTGGSAQYGLISSVAFATDDSLVTGSSLGSVVDWNLTRPARVTGVTIHAAGPTSAPVAISPDGDTIAFGEASPSNSGGGYAIGLWSVSGGRQLGTQGAFKEAVTSIAFSKDGFAAGDAAGNVTLFGASKGTYWLLNTLAGHTGSVARVGYDPDGSTLASAGSDGTVALWRVHDGILRTADSADAVAVTPDGRLLAVATRLRAGSDVALYRLPGATPVATLATGSANVAALAFSHDGRMLAAGFGVGSGGFLGIQASGAVQLWQVTAGQWHGAGQFVTHQEHFLMRLAFSDDGRFLATADIFDPTVRLWSTARLTQAAEFDALGGTAAKGASHSAVAVAFSHDGRHLAAVGSDHVTRVFSVPDGKQEGSYAPHIAASYVAFSPDGSQIAIGATGGAVYLYSVQSRQETGVLSRGSQGVSQLDYTPDGRVLTVVSGDQTVRLWNPAARTLIAAITTPANILEAAYSESTGTVVTTDASVARVWLTDPGQVARQVCRALGVPMDPTAWQTFVPQYPYARVC